MGYYLYLVNPGSTSTKTALFLDDTCLDRQVVRHDPETLQQAGDITGQLPLRLEAVASALRQALSACQIDAASIDAYVGRGGLVHPVAGGTYRINQDMLDDLSQNRYGEHASNLGALIAYELARPHGKPALIVDPPSVDEMDVLARYTGRPEIRRRSAFHALNHKAAARMAATRLGRPYDTINLIVAHLGGGISVAAHRLGRVIDVNDALQEGPFSPERAGSLPTFELIRFMLDGGYDWPAMRRLLVGSGGLCAYTGTTDCLYLEEKAGERHDYRELLEAMAYQVSKSVAAMAACLKGQVDAVVLTGGLARSSMLVDWIDERVSFLGPVLHLPGEFEMEALAAGALRVLRGEEQAQLYEKEG